MTDWLTGLLGEWRDNLNKDEMEARRYPDAEKKNHYLRGSEKGRW